MFWIDDCPVPYLPCIVEPSIHGARHLLQRLKEKKSVRILGNESVYKRVATSYFHSEKTFSSRADEYLNLSCRQPYRLDTGMGKKILCSALQTWETCCLNESLSFSCSCMTVLNPFELANPWTPSWTMPDCDNENPRGADGGAPGKRISCISIWNK